MKVSTVTLPADWASALVNGDFSGLEAADDAACRKAIAGLASDGMTVVDVVRDADGEPQEPRFSWLYDMYGGTTRGGALLDFVVHW